MSEAVLGPKSAKYRVFCGYTWKTPVYLENTWVSCRFPQFCPRFCQILPQTSSQTQGNSRVSRGKLERNRMEHQTPSGFPGNFRKRKVLGTLWFPSGLPETLGQAKPRRSATWSTGRVFRVFIFAYTRGTNQMVRMQHSTLQPCPLLLVQRSRAFASPGVCFSGQ